MFRRTVTVAALGLLMIGPARADMIYSFVDTGLGGPWSGSSQSAPVSVSFELTDAAVARGSFSMAQYNLPFWQTGSSGLDWLSASAPNLQVASGPGYDVFSMGLTFGGNGQINSSSIHLDTVGDTEYVNLSGTGRRSSGAYYTDGANACDQRAGSCTFSGHWTRQYVAVPEPESLALVGVALFGLGIVRRARGVRAGAVGLL